MAENEDKARFSYDDQFTPARSRKKRKNRPPTEPPSPAALLDKAAEELAQTHWLRGIIRPFSLP